MFTSVGFTFYTDTYFLISFQKYHEKKLGEVLKSCKTEAEKQKMTKCLSKIRFENNNEKKTM